MAPIRIGFLGLSAKSWATKAHFPYLKDSEKYQLVALCNSSTASAQAAIKHFGLPASTKAYGDPKDLAADPDVDLVVCSTRVDRHYANIKPALEAGKDVYCEWPLAANLSEARELQQLARQKGVRTMIGLQSPRSALVQKVSSLVQQGAVGKLLSVTVVADAFNFGAQDPATIAYFNEPEVGGNMISIHFGHLIDTVTNVVGQLSSFDGTMSIQRPEWTFTSDGQPSKTEKRRTPDNISLQGNLKDGGFLTVHQRGGAPFKGQPGLIWRIHGDKGDIQITARSSILHTVSDGDKIELYQFAEDAPRTIDFSVDDLASKLPGLAQSVARLYEAYADDITTEFNDWSTAVEVHLLLDTLYHKSVNSGLGNYRH